MFMSQTNCNPHEFKIECNVSSSQNFILLNIIGTNLFLDEHRKVPLANGSCVSKPKMITDTYMSEERILPNK